MLYMGVEGHRGGQGGGKAAAGGRRRAAAAAALLRTTAVPALPDGIRKTYVMRGQWTDTRGGGGVRGTQAVYPAR